MKKHIFVGGLVAVGFDPTEKYMLVVSHAGRGVFEVGNWELVARDSAAAYPENGNAIGIGPIDGLFVQVVEHYGQLPFCINSPSGAYAMEYEDGTLTIMHVA